MLWDCMIFMVRMCEIFNAAFLFQMERSRRKCIPNGAFSGSDPRVKFEGKKFVLRCQIL